MFAGDFDVRFIVSDSPGPGRLVLISTCVAC
jgi:hypothetical protein